MSLVAKVSISITGTGSIEVGVLCALLSRDFPMVYPGNGGRDAVQALAAEQATGSRV